MFDGILLIDKEAGVTSRRVDNLLGKKFSTRSVGHLGTLDPFATGLLVVGINKGTKMLSYIEDGDKTYEAVLKLGEKTSTGDPEGEIIERKEVPIIGKAQLDDVFASFLGKQSQIPPIYSAIKINGVPLYKKARKGEEVELKPREIEIFSLEGMIEGDIIRFTARVSKGTYIRVLGEDIAQKLGTVGHLLSLRRTSIGHIDVNKAKKIDDVLPTDISLGMEYVNLEKIEINEKEEWKVKNGQAIELETKEDKILLFRDDKPIAVYIRKKGNIFVSERGLF